MRTRLRPGTAARLSRERLAIPFTPVLAEPRPRAPQLSEMVYGQDFDIHEEQGRWAYGRVRALLPGSRRTDYVAGSPDAGCNRPTGVRRMPCPC